MNYFSTMKAALLQLFYPLVCAGCGSDALTTESRLCVKCIHQLPATGFEKHSPNPVEKILAGRVPYQKATAQFYFTKESLIQTLMHQLKYHGDKELGKQLGVIMGTQLLESNRYTDIEALVPLPLYENKEKKRGFNQSKTLCEGIQEVLHINIVEDAVIRPLSTETQTKKNRVERWENMQGKFRLVHDNKIAGRHVLLVDDVITTGATLEACATALLQAEGVRLSIASLCYASYI